MNAILNYKNSKHISKYKSLINKSIRKVNIGKPSKVQNGALSLEFLNFQSPLHLVINSLVHAQSLHWQEERTIFLPFLHFIIKKQTTWSLSKKRLFLSYIINYLNKQFFEKHKHKKPYLFCCYGFPKEEGSASCIYSWNHCS